MEFFVRFQISLRVQERNNILVISNEFNVKTLQATFPYVDWQDYINWNLKYAVTIDENDIIFVPDVNYLRQLKNLIEMTPQRTVANYFGWRSVLFSSSLLSSTLFHRSQPYLAAISGKQKPDAVLTACVRLTMQ